MNIDTARHRLDHLEIAIQENIKEAALIAEELGGAIKVETVSPPGFNSKYPVLVRLSVEVVI
jgi:hypothetical protein